MEDRVGSPEDDFKLNGTQNSKKVPGSNSPVLRVFDWFLTPCHWNPLGTLTKRMNLCAVKSGLPTSLMSSHVCMCTHLLSI